MEPQAAKERERERERESEGEGEREERERERERERGGEKESGDESVYEESSVKKTGPKLPTKKLIPRKLGKALGADRATYLHQVAGLEENRRDSGSSAREAYVVSAAARKKMPKTNKVASHLPPIPTGFEQLCTKIEFEPHKTGYFQAMADELGSLIDVDTFDVVKIKEIAPSDVLWNSLWQFDIKIDADGKFLKYKARLCFQGSRRKLGVDHSMAEIFTHVLRLQTLRVVQSYFIQKVPDRDMETYAETWDVKTAFVRALLHKVIYMRVPRGVTGWEGKVLRLRRALYGLAEAHKFFDEFFAEILVGIGFVRSEADSSLYVLREGREEIVIPLYVDDMIVHIMAMIGSGNIRDRVLAKLENAGLTLVISKRDNFKALGMLMEYDWKKGIVSLSQRHAKERIIEMANLTDKTPTKTPLPPGTICERPKKKDLPDITPEEVEEMKGFPYRTYLGKLGDLVQRTCPHLTYTFSQLARWADTPRPVHKKLMIHFIRFLIGDLEQKLYLKRRDTRMMACKIVHFCDSGFAQDKTDRISHGCCLAFYHGNLIWWLSRRLGFLVCSSMWAEVANTYESMAELTWERLLIKELGDGEKGPSLLWGDNYPHVLGCYNKNTNHSATKSIEVKHKWAWQEIYKGNLIVGHICRERMIADAGCKQESSKIWSGMTKVWLGEVFIPELVGGIPGKKVESLKPYRLNTNDRSDDPTLRYLLVGTRHNLDERLPDGVKNLFEHTLDDDEAFMGIAMDGLEGAYFGMADRIADSHESKHDAVSAGQNFDEKLTIDELLSEMRALSLRQARVSELIEMRVERNVNAAREMHSSVPTFPMLSYENQQELMQRDALFHEANMSKGGHVSPAYSPCSLIDDDESREGLDWPSPVYANEEKGEKGALSDESVNTQPGEWSEIESEGGEVGTESVKGRKRKIKACEIHIDDIMGDASVSMGKGNVIHHVQCHFVAKMREPVFMLMSDARSMLGRLPGIKGGCCRARFADCLSAEAVERLQ